METKFAEEISRTVKGESGVGALYIGLAAATVADIGAGAVIGVLAKNIRQDIEEEKQRKFPLD